LHGTTSEQDALLIGSVPLSRVAGPAGCAQRRTSELP